MVAVASRPATAQSQHRPQSSPDSARLTADLFFRAVADQRWNVAAAMVDTAPIRRMIRERMRWRPQPVEELTMEHFMRDDPTKPLVVAEYELKRYREQMAKINVNPVAFEFSGVASLDELGALGGLEATARFLQAQDERVQVREYMRRAGCADSLGTLAFTVHRILGVAMSSDTVAYVLHDEGRAMEQPGVGIVFEPMVMQLKLRRDGWRILPGFGLLRRLNSGIAAVECGSAKPGARRPR